MRYRPEIDGLRAIAVLSVIFCHAGLQGFQGGFVGVDVFFVISGFVITGVIRAEQAAGTFTLRRFYERRARRILPALFLVVLLCFPAAWCILPPPDFTLFAQSAAATMVALSNFFFRAQMGYFAPLADVQVLLHTWSLAVEEQYYLIFPLLLLRTRRWQRRSQVRMLAALALASLVLAVVNAAADPDKAFYLSPSRFWELLAGVLTAEWVAARGQGPRGGLAALGLGLVLIGVPLFDGALPFPGWPALVPVVGTMLVLACAGPQTWVGRALAWPGLVGIGVISYSAYLWHQPIFALVRMASAAPPGPAEMLGLIGLTLVLAYGSWALVERPFRKGRAAPVATFARLVVFGLGGAATVVTLAVTVYLADGFPQRAAVILPGDVGHELFHQMIAAQYFPCQPASVAAKALTWGSFVRCAQSRPGALPQVVLLGDSHAEHLFIGLAQGLPGQNVAFYIQNGLPLPGNPRFDAILSAMAANPDLKTVILAAYWSSRITATNQDTALSGLTALVRQFQARGLQVVLVGDVPHFPGVPASCKYQVLAVGARDCAGPRAALMPALDSPAPHRIADETGAPFIPLADLLCDGQTCSMVQNGGVVYRDANHLNVAGSMRVGGALAARLQALAAR